MGKEMKTVKDVVAAYPDGWPVKSGVVSYRDGFIFHSNRDSVYDGQKICTREEYEQELAKTNNAQWYDYDKQEAISLPPVGVEVLLHNDNELTMSYGHTLMGESCEVLAIVEDAAVLKSSFGKVCFIKELLKPLDWNKNKERDEFIDKCISTYYNGDYCKEMAKALYNAGARFND